MEERVRIIEGSANQIETKILAIQFNSLNDVKGLFTPRLENIGPGRKIFYPAIPVAGFPVEHLFPLQLRHTEV